VFSVLTCRTVSLPVMIVKFKTCGLQDFKVTNYIEPKIERWPLWFAS